MTTVTIQLDDEIFAKLTEIAKYEDRSKSSVLRRALHKYLEEQMDQSALETSYKDHMLSGKRTYTLEKIKKANDL